MNYPPLYHFIKEAEEKRIAIAHFNFSDIAGVRGIMKAVDTLSSSFHLNLPICLGTSEGELDYLGVSLAVAIKEQYKTKGRQVFLNGDHIRSLDKLKKIIDAGYDSASFDASELPFEQNIELTREAVLLAKSINPNFLIEGEITHIGGSSKVLENINNISFRLTSPEEAKQYVDATGVDLISPAVGNMHGMFKHSSNPIIDYALIKSIKQITATPIVLHGGSGLRDEDFIQAIYAGVSMIHINTEIRIAWRNGLESSFAMDKNEVAPYKLLQSAEKEVSDAALMRLKLFNKLV